MIHTRGTAAPRALEQQFAAGRLDRRTFIRRAVVLGCSATAIAGALAACGAGGAAPAGTVASVATTVAPTVAAAATAVAPTVAAAATNPAGAATAVASAAAGAAGAGPTKRGGGGTLKLLQWQAPTTFNPHLSSGTKDDLIGTIVYEPLIRADNDGNFVPFLSAGLPTKENGQLAADLKSATWKLKPNLTWSDGQPVTAADVVFTWQYIVDPKTASVNVSLFENVDKVEQVDDLTIRYTFSDVKPDWYRPAMLQVLPKHVFENDKGELVGMDIAMAKILAKGLFDDDSKVEFVQEDPAQRIPNVTTGKVDIVIQFMTVTPQRAQLINFSRPYYVEGIALLTRPDAANKGFDALLKGGAETKVSILQNVDADRYVHQVLPQAQVLQVDTQANVVQALESKRVDAAAVDLSTVRWMVAKNPGRYADSGKTWQSQLYSAGVKQGDLDWLTFVNTCFDVAMFGNDSAVYDAAFKEYFGVDLPPRVPGFPTI